MLHDCPHCGEAYADEATVTLCPRCEAETTATFERPVSLEQPSRRAAWAAGLGAAALIGLLAVVGWAALDMDGDGASTYQEIQTGSDPFDADTNDDGVLDGRGPATAGVGSVPCLTGCSEPQQQGSEEGATPVETHPVTATVTIFLVAFVAAVCLGVVVAKSVLRTPEA